MRREWPLRVPCTEPGCGYEARYRYDSRRDLESSFERLHAATFKCSRHAMKERVLTPQNTTVEWMSEPVREESYGKYVGSSGVLISPAYYVDAKDFPVGTRFKITCEAILP